MRVEGLGWQGHVCAVPARLPTLLHSPPPPPTLPAPQSLLRCRWAVGDAFSLDWVLKVAIGVAAALEHMHYRGIAHGEGVDGVGVVELLDCNCAACLCGLLPQGCGVHRLSTVSVNHPAPPCLPPYHRQATCMPTTSWPATRATPRSATTVRLPHSLAASCRPSRQAPAPGVLRSPPTLSPHHHSLPTHTSRRLVLLQEGRAGQVRGARGAGLWAHARRPGPAPRHLLHRCAQQAQQGLAQGSVTCWFCSVQRLIPPLLLPTNLQLQAWSRRSTCSASCWRWCSSA